MPQYEDGKTLKWVIENCNHKGLTQAAWIESFLKSIAHLIHMKIIGGPLTVKFESPKDGVSSVLLIAESHIAIHTWPHDDAFRLVVDSCKDFKEDILKCWLYLVFGPSIDIKNKEL